MGGPSDSLPCFPDLTLGIFPTDRFRAIFAATAKGAAHAYARGLHPLLAAAGLPIRVNTLAPSWAESAVLPGMKELMAKLGIELRE